MDVGCIFKVVSNAARSSLKLDDTFTKNAYLMTSQMGIFQIRLVHFRPP